MPRAGTCRASVLRDPGPAPGRPQVRDLRSGRESDKDETDTGTVGVNWYLKGHDLKLMLNYLRVQADGPEDQDKVLARLQVIF